MPQAIKPQLATLVSEAPEGETWLHEIKLDGYRLLAWIKNGEVQLFTRNGLDWTHRFASMARALAALPCKTAILDGEAVVMNARGVSGFQELQNVLKRGREDDVTFYVFDLLFLNGKDLRRCDLLSRKQQLTRLLSESKDNSRVRISEHVIGHGARFHGEACQLGLEGIVSKRIDASYEAGRNKAWLKVKCLQRQEFVVVGFTDPSGARRGLGALLLGVYEDKTLRYTGKVGTGFNAKTLAALYAELQPLERKSAPVKNPPRGADAKGIHWVAPQMVVEVAFTEWTDDSLIRHPSFQGLREDKPARDIVKEQPQPPPPQTRAPARKRTVSDPVVAGVRITHPDKVLFPEGGFTKLQLARYYEEVATWALPHLQNRPLTLLRCPEGYDKTCFFQKHANATMPKQIPRVKVKETQAGQQVYMMVDELPALIRLVQLGVMEFHVWGSQADRLEQPDIVVFDLDPAPEVPWKDMVTTAVALRERLQQLGFAAYPRFTGGKGIHVVVPLQPRASWDEVKAFSLAIADEFVHRAPKFFSSKLAKRGREGKIFIDYLRNGRNATAVASFSSRAKPGAPIALPVRWQDIETQREGPLLVSIIEAPTWIQKLGQDPWAGFDKDRKALTKRILREVGVRSMQRP